MTYTIVFVSARRNFYAQLVKLPQDPFKPSNVILLKESLYQQMVIVKDGVYLNNDCLFDHRLPAVSLLVVRTVPLEG